MMPNESLQLKDIVKSRQTIFLQLLLVSFFLALGRYLWPWPSDWFQFVFRVFLFMSGVLIAPFIFLTEPTWKALLIRKFSLQFRSQESPLRTGVLLILLPILGLFVLTSSRSPIGFGFLWGISAWYASEVWQMLNGHTNLLQAYFPNKQYRQELPLIYIFWGYCVYAALLTFGILFIQ